MLYDRAFGKFQFGQASAVGLISSITIVVLTLVMNKTFKLDNQEVN
jgi:ABC-type sugar transport system permease subunit